MRTQASKTTNLKTDTHLDYTRVVLHVPVAMLVSSVPTQLLSTAQCTHTLHTHIPKCHHANILWPRILFKHWSNHPTVTPLSAHATAIQPLNRINSKHMEFCTFIAPLPEAHCAKHLVTPHTTNAAEHTINQQLTLLASQKDTDKSTARTPLHTSQYIGNFCTPT